MVQTNHREVEFALLSRSNLQQSLRFVLGGSQSQGENNTNVIQQLFRISETCPALFASIMPIEERLEKKSETQEDAVPGDKRHIDPQVRQRIPKRELITLALPSTFTQLPINDWRLSQLRVAYEREYQRPNIVQIAGTSLAWYKKLFFTDE